MAYTFYYEAFTTSIMTYTVYLVAYTAYFRANMGCAMIKVARILWFTSLNDGQTTFNGAGTRTIGFALHSHCFGLALT